MGSPRRRSGIPTVAFFFFFFNIRSGSLRRAGRSLAARGAPRAVCASASRAPARGIRAANLHSRERATARRVPRASPARASSRAVGGWTTLPTTSRRINQRSPKPLPPRPSSQASRATCKSVTTAALSEPPFQAMVRPDPHPHPRPRPAASHRPPHPVSRDRRLQTLRSPRGEKNIPQSTPGRGPQLRPRPRP